MKQICSAIFDKDFGVATRLDEEEKKMDRVEGKCVFQGKENKALKTEVQILKGIVGRQYGQIQTLNNKVVELMSRSMSNNLVITGLKEMKGEDCRETVHKFLHDHVEESLEMADTQVAHRLGVYRPMIIIVFPLVREHLLEHTKKLKGLKNDLGKAYFVSRQQPEVVTEAKKNAKALFKNIRRKMTNYQVTGN